MATHNYYGFAPAGAQYSTQPVTAYATIQPVTFVQTAQPAAYAPVAPAFEATTTIPQAATAYVPTSSIPTQYAYATRTAQVVVPIDSCHLAQAAVPIAVSAYDASSAKTYYTPTAASAVAPASGQAATIYAIQEPYRQAAAVYSTTFTAANQTPRYMTVSVSAVKVPPPTSQTSAVSYVYGTTPTLASPCPTYPAQFAKPTAYTLPVSQQSPLTPDPHQQASSLSSSPAIQPMNQQQPAGWQSNRPYNRLGFSSNNKDFGRFRRPGKLFPSLAQQEKQKLYYCDVCKISCAGTQTYDEHMKGSKHKKKEASAKNNAAIAANSRSGQLSLRCELCDVTCTSVDAHSAHLRGLKHQKVLSLHTRLGKPIPPADQVGASNGIGNSSIGMGTAPLGTYMAGPLAGQTVSSLVANYSGFAASGGGRGGATADPKVTAADPKASPKVTFVGGRACTGVNVKGAQDVREELARSLSKVANSDQVTDSSTNNSAEGGDSDVTPVGNEYMDETRNEVGTVVSIHCKLCDCRFTDVNAKIMHMKGRRHRLNYKFKVDPSLKVTTKPSFSSRRQQEERMQRQMNEEEIQRCREVEMRWRMEMDQRCFEGPPPRHFGPDHSLDNLPPSPFHFGRGPPDVPPGFLFGPTGMGPRPPGPMFDGHGLPGMVRRVDSLEDRYVMAKHKLIYPSEEELKAVQKIVSACERGLRLISETMCGEIESKVVSEKDKDEGTVEKKKESGVTKILKGVIRIGVLAKGLLIKGDLNVELVALCAQKPTQRLLKSILDELPSKIASFTEDKYIITSFDECPGILVKLEIEPATTCRITLTSTLVQEVAMSVGDDGNEEEDVVRSSAADPSDMLDTRSCLKALAALRRAKWFEDKVSKLTPCLVVIRILRDLCQRIPSWTCLSQWAVELLVEKCFVSASPINRSPGDILVRVFECISSGLLLTVGPGLVDPCEKSPVDACAGLSIQDAENITESAMHALRMIAFRNMHKVLGIGSVLETDHRHKRPLSQATDHSDSQDNIKKLKTGTSD